MYDDDKIIEQKENVFAFACGTLTEKFHSILLNILIVKKWIPISVIHG